MELFALCEAKGWQVIIGIEPDNNENIDDIKKLEAGIKPCLHFNLHHQEMLPAHAEVENNINAVAENSMRLKHYQEKVIKALKDYLGELDIARNEYEEMLAIKPNLAKHINFPKDAWEKSPAKLFIIPKQIV